MIRYKVVRILPDGQRVSCLAYQHHQQKYPLGETIMVGGIGAMCFMKQHQAKTFIHKMFKYGVFFDCESFVIIRVKPLCRATKVINWTNCFDTLHLDDYYTLNAQDGCWRYSEHTSKPSHTGTVCYKQLEILT